MDMLFAPPNAQSQGKRARGMGVKGGGVVINGTERQRVGSRYRKAYLHAYMPHTCIHRVSYIPRPEFCMLS